VNAILAAARILVLCVATAFVGSGATAGLRPVPQQDAEQRYNSADAVFTDGDPEAALQMFDALIADYPRSRYPSISWRSAAGVRAGEIALSLGRIEESAARFVSVVDGADTSAWASRARLGLATSLLLSREWSAAAHLLQEVVDDFSAGAPSADARSGIAAAERLTLLHRVWLRAGAGELPWQQSGRFDVGMVLDRPIGVAASSNGVLVSDEGLDALIFRDSSGTAATFTVPDTRRPWWSPLGDAYVAARSAVSAPLLAASFRFAVVDGSRQRAVDDIRAGARTATGGWALLDNRSKRVMQFSLAGAFEGALDMRDGEPVDLVRGPRGRLFVIEKSRREVMVFEADGALRGGFAIETWREPYALDADAVGNIYVLDRGNKRIDVFDPDGGILWSLGPVLPGGVQLDDPRDIAVDGSGRIFVADRGRSVLVVIE
jgi:hypothetical protein